MKGKVTAFAVLLTISLIFVTAPPGMAYIIDGNLTDWGLEKLQDNAWDWSNEETWLPADNVRFVVEDNFDPLHNNTGSYTGVHIKGVGSSYSVYNELKRINAYTGNEVSEPWGGEYHDLEARYLDQDDENLYIAIVTSLNPELNGDRRPGDLALDIDLNSGTGDLGYEYGIWIHADSLQGTVFKDPVWEKIGYLLPILPDRITPSTGTEVGSAEIAYNNNWLTRQDWEKDNYVIEMAIPKEILGLSSGDIISENSVMYSDNCMNDHIFIPGVPEFFIAAVPVGIIFAFILLISLIIPGGKNQK